MEKATAYILIDVVGDKVAACLAALRAIPGVTRADAVAGPYDIIALVEADSHAQIGETVVGKIRHVDGVHETITCFSMELDA
jgi:DNA-binding Lrp family transcriptional regulator